MKRLIPIAFLFTCALLPYLVFAQKHNTVPTTKIIDSLQAVLRIQNDDTNKVNILNKLSNRHRMLGNYDSALPYAENAQALAEKIGFKRGIADAFENIGGIYFRQSNYKKALEYIFKTFTIYQDIGNKQGIANALNHIGLIYYNLGNYSKALEYYFKVLTIAQEIKDKNTIANVFCSIGIIYGEQGNYSKGLEYLFKSLEIQIKKGDKDAIAIDLGNIGYSYLLQSNYPKAVEYDFKAVTQAQEVGDKDVIATEFDNIGDTYYEQGNYVQALEYDFKAVTIAGEIGDKDEIANLYSNIGRVYVKLKNYEQAKKFLDSALTFSQKTGDKKYIKNTYRNLAILDSAKASYKTAYDNYKKYIAYRDSLINQESVKQITQIEITYAFEKREDSIRVEYEKENIIKTAQINRKKILNDSAIVILALTVLLALLLINRQQIKRKKDKIISEKEKTMLVLENQRMETENQRMEAENQRMEAEKQHIADELLNAKKALEDHTKNMAEKNELLEQFKTDIEKLKNLKSKELEEVRIEQLEYLNKTTILTEEDWNKFKELFEQVYKGFFVRLKEKWPNLTQAERRFICLTKLKLDTRQMASILVVSSDTIKISRYRLRRKLHLSEDDNLDDIITSI